MSEKINIAELLKDCPKGMELYSPLVGDCKFVKVHDYESKIIVELETGATVVFQTDGRYFDYPNAECLLFPKGKTTWEGFVPPCQSEDGKIFATNNGLIIGIIKVKNNRQVGAYCSIDYSGDFRINSDYWFERMATYEEKEKLFNAIKANGYKWNEETKTLEKLPKFKVDDKIKLKGGDEFGIITQVTDCFFTIKCRNNTHCWPIKKQDDWELINEPKFKVGDRIKAISNSTQLCQYLIIGITDTHYTLEEVEDKFKYTEPIGNDKNWELVADKFDISILKPFESKVLVRDSINSIREYDEEHTDVWRPAIWGVYVKDNLYPFGVQGGCYFNYCIPYEGNEHLLGTTDDCDEYFKNW